jgi:hypothetical protein
VEPLAAWSTTVELLEIFSVKIYTNYRHSLEAIVHVRFYQSRPGDAERFPEVEAYPGSTRLFRSP